MFRPQIQKTGVLLSLATYCTVMVFLVFITRQKKETYGFEDKIKTTNIMKSALKVLKKEVDNPHVSIDNDPNKTRLIFDDHESPMITHISDKPTLESKQTVLKPNFSALLVDMFIKADISKGDTIAVGMTGSFPGANIALYSVCEAMELVPIIITSIGANEWGAIDSDYTWLDLERILFENKIISHKSIAASLGGWGDMFILNPDSLGGSEGKQLAEKAIIRNDIKRIVYKKEDKVVKRDSVYKDNIHDNDLANYSAFVNIGGGVGSFGVKERRYGYGILDKERVLSNTVDEKLDGIVQIFAQSDVQLINIQQIEKLIKNENGISLIFYGIDNEDPDITGDGPLFYFFEFNLLITVLALLSTIGVVVIIGMNSFREINKHMNTYERESIL